MNAWNEYQAQRLKELEVENKAQRDLIDLYDQLLDEMPFPLSLVYKLHEIREARRNLSLEEE